MARTRIASRQHVGTTRYVILIEIALCHGTCPRRVLVEVENLSIKSIRRGSCAKPRVRINVCERRRLKFRTRDCQKGRLWNKDSETLSVSKKEQFVLFDRSTE